MRCASSASDSTEEERNAALNIWNTTPAAAMLTPCNSRTSPGSRLGAAMAKMPDAGAPIVACLACTHYGYRKEFFEEALARAQGALVINPNESAVDDLFDRTGNSHDVDVRFVTRYAIPPATIETLTWLLQRISPRTVDALQHFEHVPDLF